MAVTQHRDTHIEALALIYSRLRVTVKLIKLLWGSDLFDLFWVSASLRYGSASLGVKLARAQRPGYWWQDHEKFDIERLLDKKVERHMVGKGKKRSEKEFVFYKVLWDGFPPEVATWATLSESLFCIRAAAISRPTR